MIQSFYRANKELMNKLLFLTAFLITIYLFLNFLFPYIAPFVFGYVFSLILIPIVNLLESKLKIPRGITSILLIVLVLFLIFVLGTNIVTKIASEIKALSDNWPTYLQQLTVLANNLKQNYENLLEFIPDQFAMVAETAITTLTASLTSTISSLLKQGSVGIVVSAPNFLMSTLLCIISMFFFTKDSNLIKKSIKKNTPIWLSESYTTIKGALLHAILGYGKAQLILMTFTAAICIVGLSIIKFPYALLIGIAASLIDALPVFGVGFILWPLALITFMSGNTSTALGIMIIDVIVILVRQFLEPKILGSQIGLHPLLTLISIYVGLRVFGVLGFIIGPMILVVSKVILEAKNVQKPVKVEIEEKDIESETVI